MTTPTPPKTPSVPPTPGTLTPLTPVLEIGGTHVTAALIQTSTWTLAGEPVRHHVSADGPAGELLATFAAAADSLNVPLAATWAVAIPDPFDYAAGIGRFHGVAKFESLNGVSVRDELLKRLPGEQRSILFLNDADAFALGEWVNGAAEGADRVLGLTLGTGVGSGWVSNGAIVVPESPPGGRVHLLPAGGHPLEDTMSRRAIRAAYHRETGDATADVADIASRARAGEVAARGVLAHALGELGRVLAEPIRRFAPEVIVAGGSMSRSWDLLGPWFSAGAGLPSGSTASSGFGAAGGPVVRPAVALDTASLIGAAWFASSQPA